jgi:hypothetical protein
MRVMSSRVDCGKNRTPTIGGQTAHRAIPRRRIAISIGLLLMAILTTPAPDTCAQSAGEYSVKAACLYRFAQFIDWPADSLGNDNAPLIVGVLGQDPFGGAIDQVIAGKTVNGRPLVIRRFQWGEDLRHCHILFISSSEQKRLSQILNSLKGASVLTVGEMDQFGQQGGMIRFILSDGKVTFEINLTAGEQARLRFSSKLLALAKAVRGRH